jgi:TIR domain
MVDIFLSYSSKDRERAALLAQALTLAGLTVFWDRKIPAGMNYHEYLENQLKSARLVVVIWTPSAVASDWVRLEADEGIERDALLPVLMQDVQVPLRFKQIQMADLRSWRGSPEERSFKDLVDAIGRKMGGRKPGPQNAGGRIPFSPPIPAPPSPRGQLSGSQIKARMRSLAWITALIVACWIWHVTARFHNPWIYAQSFYYYQPTLHWIYVAVTTLLLPIAAAALTNNYRLTLLIPPLANLPPDLIHAVGVHDGKVSLPDIFIFSLVTMIVALPAAVVASIRGRRSGYVVHLTS